MTGHSEWQALLSQSADLWREVGETRGLAWTLGRWALAVHGREPGRAHALLEEAIALLRKANDTLVLAYALAADADLAMKESNHDGTASVCYQESLQSWREIGLKYFIAGSLVRLAHVALCQGEWDEAHSHLKEALILFREMAWTGSGDVIGALVGCVGLACAQGQPERATRLLGAAAVLLAPVGGELALVYVPLRDRVESALHADLAEAAFAAAWHEGEMVSAEGGERAVAYALNEGT